MSSWLIAKSTTPTMSATRSARSRTLGAKIPWRVQRGGAAPGPGRRDRRHLRERVLRRQQLRVHLADEALHDRIVLALLRLRDRDLASRLRDADVRRRDEREDERADDVKEAMPLAL